MRGLGSARYTRRITCELFFSWIQQDKHCEKNKKNPPIMRRTQNDWITLLFCRLCVVLEFVNDYYATETLKGYPLVERTIRRKMIAQNI